LYWEGSDQHRGWFQSSFLTGVALTGSAPFEECRTHGFVLDGDGKKMSKSRGNVVDPAEFMEEFGADVLRLWLVSGGGGDDLCLSQESRDAAVNSYRKLRGMLRFCLANLSDFDVDKYSPATDLPSGVLMDDVHRAMSSAALNYSSGDFAAVRRDLDSFLSQLSSEHLGTETSGLKKDLYRCYDGGQDDPERRAAQRKLYCVYVALVTMAEPLTPHLVAEAWHER